VARYPSEPIARCCTHVFSCGGAPYPGKVAILSLVSLALSHRFVIRFLRCHATCSNHQGQRPRRWLYWLGTACLLGEYCWRRCLASWCSHPGFCCRCFIALSVLLFQPSRARPKPSLKPTRYGRLCQPGLRYAVLSLTPGHRASLRGPLSYNVQRQAHGCGTCSSRATISVRVSKRQTSTAIGSMG